MDFGRKPFIRQVRDGLTLQGMVIEKYDEREDDDI